MKFEPTRSFAYRFSRYSLLPELQQLREVQCAVSGKGAVSSSILGVSSSILGMDISVIRQKKLLNGFIPNLPIGGCQQPEVDNVSRLTTGLAQCLRQRRLGVDQKEQNLFRIYRACGSLGRPP
ncbi:MAG TPA: hypothetical protein VKT76_10145 [Bradyrhizobium sp.]|nr:hypothetical protein [Bradyrhizobium sp.]